MDPNVIDLVRSAIELGFFTLIMMGCCTAVLCLTRVWTNQKLVEAINGLPQKDRVSPVIEAAKAPSRRLLLRDSKTAFFMMPVYN